MSRVAVLTGDIVKSQRLAPGQLDAIFDAMGTAADRIGGWSGLPPRLTRMRGDGWQLVTTARFGPRALIQMRAAVRSVSKDADTRIAVGMGTARIPGDTLADAEGPAFVASGHALEAMGARDRLAGPDWPWLGLLDHVSRDWTERQAQTVLEALAPARPTQAQVAEHLGVTQQTAQRHWDSAGVDALRALCEALEQDAGA